MFSNLVNITKRETDSQRWRANQWGEGSGEGQDTARGFKGTNTMYKIDKQPGYIIQQRNITNIV